jgi:hypothetical protein
MIFVVIAAASSASAGDTVLTVNCGDAANTIHVARRGTFDGPIPTGCAPDYPSWNNSTASTLVLTEKERRFLRFNVSRLDHAVLFRLPNTTITAPGYYIVETVCRCAQSPLNAHIRQIQSPFHTF